SATMPLGRGAADTAVTSKLHMTAAVTAAARSAPLERMRNPAFLSRTLLTGRAPHLDDDRPIRESGRSALLAERRRPEFRSSLLRSEGVVRFFDSVADVSMGANGSVGRVTIRCRLRAERAEPGTAFWRWSRLAGRGHAPRGLVRRRGSA